jgi:hypothetical protein
MFSCSTAATWANRAACYLKLNKHQEALHDARVARVLDPKYVKVWSCHPFLSFPGWATLCGSSMWVAGRGAKCCRGFLPRPAAGAVSAVRTWSHCFGGRGLVVWEGGEAGCRRGGRCWQRNGWRAALLRGYPSMLANPQCVSLQGTCQGTSKLVQGRTCQAPASRQLLGRAAALHTPSLSPAGMRPLGGLLARSVSPGGFKCSEGLMLLLCCAVLCCAVLCCAVLAF